MLLVLVKWAKQAPYLPITRNRGPIWLIFLMFTPRLENDHYEFKHLQL